MKIVLYYVGFTEPAMKFWWQISKSVSRGFANKVQNSLNQNCTIFSCIFCLIFLIDAIKPNENKKIFKLI